MSYVKTKKELEGLLVDFNAILKGFILMIKQLETLFMLIDSQRIKKDKQ